MTHQLGAAPVIGFVDKRRRNKNDAESRIVGGPTLFTANGAGTTTTIVGGNGYILAGVNNNIVRIGDEFKIYSASGALKEDTVFRVVDLQAAANTTITFTPAAAVATANGDYLRLAGISYLASNAEKDRRLSELGFTSSLISKLTENDKDYQLRVSDDWGST